MSDELTTILASIQEFMVGMSRHLDQIESSRPVGINIDELISHASQTTQVLPPRTIHGILFHFLDHFEITPSPAPTMSPPIVPITYDTILAEQEVRIERLESRMRQIRSQDESVTWDNTDGIPVASLPTNFHMPNIEHYSGVGCPKIHPRLYRTVMRAYMLDDAQLVTIFPMSLSGATQRWFASVEPLRFRT